MSANRPQEDSQQTCNDTAFMSRMSMDGTNRCILCFFSFRHGMFSEISKAFEYKNSTY